MSDDRSQNQVHLKRRNQLVLDHLYLIKQLLQRLLVKVPNSLGKDDLIGVASIGLLDAANRFDETLGVKFSSYAQKRIRGAIYDELRRHSLGGQRICKQAKEIERCIARKERETGKVPKDVDIAKELNISTSELQNRYQDIAGSYLIYIDAEQNQEFVFSTDSDWLHSNLEDKLLIQEKKQKLIEAIKRLGTKEQFVLNLYYYQELSLKEIASILSISESRVSQIHSKALIKLRGLTQESFS